MKSLSREEILRMVDGKVGGNNTTVESGGGAGIDLSGYVTLQYLKTLTWWGQGIPDNSTEIVGAMTGVGDITMTGAISGTTNLTMTGSISGTTNLTMTGYITGTTNLTMSGRLTIGGFVIEVVNGDLKFNGNIFATGSVSALGQGSGGSGGAVSLADLVDTTISNPSNGQVLKYDSTSGKWINGSITPGSTTLSGLTDTSISSPTNGQVLKYNSTSGKWENANESGGGGGTGTVTSVALSVPTGLSVSGSPITTSGTLAISFASGYSLPTTAKQSNWDLAYGWGDHSLAGYVEEEGNTMLQNVFEPKTNGGAQLGSNSFRFSDVFGQNGNFTYLTVNGTKPSSPATNGLQIGDGLISWDSTNNAFKIQKKDGTAANLYALGGISALGMSSGTNGKIAANLIPETSESYTLGNDSYGWSELYLADNGGGTVTLGVDGDGNLTLTGTSQGFSLMVNGDVYAGRFYLDTLRYLFVQSGTLKYFNGSTTKTIMLQ